MYEIQVNQLSRPTYFYLNQELYFPLTVSSDAHGKNLKLALINLIDTFCHEYKKIILRLFHNI